MTQTERIEKTTQIFSRADRNIINTTFNEVQSVIDDYLNEHLGSVLALETPFFIKNLESRLKMYEKITTVTMPNMFNMKDGAKND